MVRFHHLILGWFYGEGVGGNVFSLLPSFVLGIGSLWCILSYLASVPFHFVVVVALCFCIVF